MYRLSTDRKAVVSTDTQWLSIADTPPPMGARALFIAKPYGVAVLGEFSPKFGWTHWHPLPKFPKDTK